MMVSEDTIINFGRHKGCRLSDLPRQYRAWLAEPRLRDGSFAKVPEHISAYVKDRLEREKFAEDRLGGMESSATDYIVERLGDISGETVHSSLKDALCWLSECEYNTDGGDRNTPDPEDDRILIWEVLPSGHKKVLWHFSGWHWDAEEFYGLEQGRLGEDESSLYSLALTD